MTRALFNPVTLLLAIMSLEWIEPFGIKLSYYCLALAIFYTVFSPKRWSTAAQFTRDNAAWLVPLVLYLTIITAILHGSPGTNIGPRQFFFVLGGVGIAASLATTRDIATVLRFGAGAGIIVLIGVIEYFARRLGLSLFDVLREFANGNLNFVFYGFFRTVFNALTTPGDLLVGASTKNDVADCLLIVGLLFRAGSAKSHRDLVGSIGLGVVLVLLLLLNTRSVLIAAGASIFLAVCMGAAIRPGKSLPRLLLKGGAALAALVIALGMSISDSAASGAMSDRFSFDDVSAGARLDQFGAALTHIQLHPLAGNGYFEFDGYLIHNLFLGAWVHAGIIAFLLVTGFYVALLVRWLRTLKTFVTHPRAWVLPISPEWIAPLPVLPLIRVWLSGDAGHPFIGEWIAISVFFGCVLANSLHRRRLLTQTTRGRAVRPVTQAYDGASRQPSAVPIKRGAT